MSDTVCDPCARRTWLLGRLAGHLETARSRIGELLALDDAGLVAAVAGSDRDAVTAQLDEFDAGAAAASREAAGLDAVCVCDPGYPPGLRELDAPPAVLHVAGGGDRLAELLAEPSVAIVGARRASAYGRATATALAGELAAVGLTVVSGLALGVDAAAHRGALRAGGGTLAVLPAAAHRAYPRTHRELHRRIVATGVAVSELAPGVEVRRWMFPARNRIIAALAELTVVVQARPGSGALLTARWARRLRRGLGAVPGPIDLALSQGPHTLLRSGAVLITGAGDVLEWRYGEDAPPLAARPPVALEPALAGLLDALAHGEEGEAAFARAGLDADGGLAALAALELAGCVRRGAGGRYVIER